MEALDSAFKHIYACDLAAGLGFEWDYENAPEYDLYEALEAMGYTWNGEGWYTAEYLASKQTESTPAPRGRWGREASDQEKLRQWLAGEPIRKKGGPQP